MPWAAIFAFVQLVVPLVEQMFPQKGAGAQKYDQAMNMVKAVATVVPEVVSAVQGGQAAIHAGNVEQLTGHIGSLINATVGVMNEAGVFQKSALVQNARPAAPPALGQSD